MRLRRARFSQRACGPTAISLTSGLLALQWLYPASLRRICVGYVALALGAHIGRRRSLLVIGGRSSKFRLGRDTVKNQ
jgi:hypothetical protein